jgi:hypothetical protein
MSRSAILIMSDCTSHAPPWQLSFLITLFGIIGLNRLMRHLLILAARGRFPAFSQRYNSAKLTSNTLATPVFAEQSRHNSTYTKLQWKERL